MRPIIRRGKKVKLGKLLETDVPILWKILCELNQEYFLFKTCPSLEEEYEWFASYGATNFAILDEKDRLIGVIGFRRMDTENKRVEIGYWIAREFQGKGYATEAVSLFLDFCFNTLGLNSVYARTNALNVASWKVLEKNGFVRFGTYPQARWFRGNFVDEYWYCIHSKNYKGID